MNTQHNPVSARVVDHIPTSRISVPRSIEETEPQEMQPRSPRTKEEASFFEGITLGSAFDFVTDPLGDDKHEVGLSIFKRRTLHPFDL